MSTRFGRYNFTIDDSSPMITYDPVAAWIDDVAADRNLRSFFQSSYHVTNQASASASLTFTGTGISIIGSKANTHDTFEFRVDNQTITGLTGFAGANQFQAVLAQIKGLRFGSHTVKITNLLRTGTNAGALLDIDALIVESVGGRNSAGQVPSTLVDDATIGAGTNQVAYTGNWATTSTTAAAASFVNGTVHETITAGASVALNFVGDGVQVVGAIGRVATQFTAQLDDAPAVTLNSQSPTPVTGSTLFFRNDLAPGQHRLVLTKVGATGALTVDAFQVFGVGTGMTDAIDVDPTVLETMPALANGNVGVGDNNNGGAGNNNTNGGAAAGKPNVLLIGIIAGIAVLVLILVGGVSYYFYKRKKEREEENSYYPGGGNGGGGDLEAGAGLMRSNSDQTAVDDDRPSRLGGLARGLTRIGTKNTGAREPATPSLPMQDPGAQENSPPMVEVGLDSGGAGPAGGRAGVGAGFGGRGAVGGAAGRYNRNNEEAYGGMVEYGQPSKFKSRQQQRMSIQELSRAPSQRSWETKNDWGDGSGPAGGGRSRRGRFSGSTVDEWERDRYRDEDEGGERTPMLPPAARPKYGLGMGGPAARRDISDEPVGRSYGAAATQSNRRQRRSTGQFSDTRYTYSNAGGGGRYSPPISEIPDTPQPRYEIDRDEVPVTNRQTLSRPGGGGLGRNGTVRGAKPPDINGGIGSMPNDSVNPGGA
ncbi:hypothetical protein FRC20_003170, partial [Serendipita sp. 405]